MLFKKLTVTYGEFKGSTAVYRIVRGDLQALQKEQSIFTRRAHSLWGKEMKSWPTFRIIFPKFSDKYSIFGIIVPDSFNCDKECLEELGFKLGTLDSLPLTAKIEVPTRFCYSLKLNQYRACKVFKSIIKGKHYKIAENRIQYLERQKNMERKSNFSNDHDFSQIEMNNDVNDVSTNQNGGHMQSKNCLKQNNKEVISQSDVKQDLGQDFINIENGGSKNRGSIEGIQAEKLVNGISKNNKVQNNILSGTYQDQNKYLDNLEEVLEELIDDPPFVEIRYKKKRKQIFIMPLMNYDKLVGLWKPVYFQC